jgi:response regulator RpfG family c-di-GMP phosphodiesterase
MAIPRILLVDDEPNVLKAVRRIFMDDDLDITTAASGQEALDHLQSNPVDLILSDHNMPGMTGVDFLAKASELYPETVRMLLTGRGELDIVLQAINQGRIYKFFNKPWDDDDLRISILRALEFKSAQEKMRKQEAELARSEIFQHTMITVSHYINNFNCALTMSLESLRETASPLTEADRKLVNAAIMAADKVTAVLRILNRVEELKVVQYDEMVQMIDIETEVKEAVKRIEEGE